MEKVQHESTGPSLKTPSPESVREHLGRLLASPHFRTSKRCCEFLSFVVERSLEGREQEIKERTLGVAIFGRPQNYETAADPIVRVKANEVRKRLAQYYRETGVDELLQIELPSGAYLPEFHWAGSTVREPLVTKIVESPSRSGRWLTYILIVVVLAGATGFFLKWTSRTSELDEFWAPFVHNSGTPLICVGVAENWMLSKRLKTLINNIPPEGTQPTSVAIMPGEVAHLLNHHMSLGNLESVLALSTLLTAKGKPSQLRMGASLSMDDMLTHPVIAIGAFNNQWTIRRNAEMRFSFEGDGTEQAAPLSIRDRLNPERKWTVTDRFPWKTQPTDYAIISRLFDPASGNVFITMAGINSFGTQAAGEFLSKPRYWKELVQTAPTGWQKMNLQVVLETTVVGTTPSAPRVLATHFW